MKNGNVIVDGSLSREIVVVVLSDNFHPENRMENGNIYVTPKVGDIYALLYAD